MIGGVSIALAAYEIFAMATRRPTITTLSHTKLGVLIWLWLVALAMHLWRSDR